MKTARTILCYGLYMGDVRPSMNTVQLRKFDPSTMVQNCVIIAVGMRGTGKSILLTDLLYHKRNIPVGLVISATEGGNRHFGKYVPDLFVHSEFNMDVIVRALKRQKKLVYYNAPNPECFLLLDDCLYDRRNLNNETVREVFKNGRHWKITFMLSAQYLMDLPSDLRGNIDYAFFLKESSIQNRERIYKNFFGVIPTFQMFNRIFNECTEGYGCMVLDNRARSNRIEDCVFWYEADPNLEYRMGSKAFWKEHDRKYNPRYLEKEFM